MMSDKPVRSHTNISNRAKPKDTYERKVVYKSVLDNPFIISWCASSCSHQTCFILNRTFVRPKIPANVQNAIISQTAAVLDGVAEYQMRRRVKSRKRKSTRDPGPHKRQRTTVPAGNNVLPPSAAIEAVQMELDDVAANGSDLPLALDAPDVLRYMTLGINEVTKKIGNFSENSASEANTSGVIDCP